jgi:hypothetical protein
MTQVKLFDPFARRAGTSLDEFSMHWTERHAEIARLRIPEIRHYVQSHRLEGKPAALGAPLGEPSCDGSSETWYDSPAGFRSMLPGEGVAALMVDEPNFIDLSLPRSPVMTHEHPIDAGRFDPARHGVKVLLFLRRAPGAELDHLHARLVVEEMAELGRAVGATRHVACTTVPESYSTFIPNDELDKEAIRPYDAVRELWWPDAAGLERGAAQAPEAWKALVHPAESDVPGSFALFARERVIVP